MEALEELGRLLRPAAGGLYLVSTGLAEQQALQQQLYGAASAAEVDARWREALGRISHARAIIMGIPSDVGAGFLRGANLGPQAIRTALARVPADRYASVAEFATALASPEAFRAPARSVAVLPFLSLSGDPENEYFADGITEDVIAQLSKIRSLKVISRTSVMMFKRRDQSLREIGALLSAATLLEGSVRRVGDRVRIVAQLIDAETDRHLWAETYDRQLTDIFAIQDEIANAIVAALRGTIGTAFPP